MRSVISRGKLHKAVDSNEYTVSLKCNSHQHISISYVVDIDPDRVVIEKCDKCFDAR